ncbi:MAG: alpha/beta hydrolase [Pseudomonadota bacterium]
MPPTLMLLPGLVCDAAVWSEQSAALPARCVVPAWGLRNSLSSMAQQVLQEAPTERFALAGHSMGGRVALEVMRMAPHRVERIALLDTGTHPLAEGEAGARERAGRMTLLEVANTRGMRAMGAQWARGMVHPSRLGSPLFESVLDMIERSSPAQFAAQIEALLGRPDAAPLLPTIACPALVLCGREDAWSPPAQHVAMHEAIPRSELVIVEQCGHMCTMEQPDAINAALAKWLAISLEVA